MLPEAPEDFGDNSVVCPEVRMSDEDVVQIDHDIPGENEVLENVVHYGLERRRGVGEPKYITSGSNSPWLVRNAAFHSSPFRIRTLLNPHRTSSFVKNRAPFNRLIRSLIKGMGYRFFIVIALSAR